MIIRYAALFGVVLAFAALAFLGLLKDGTKLWFTTQVGTLQTAPIAIAVLTAYLAVSGTGTLMALAKRARKPAAPSARPA